MMRLITKLGVIGLALLSPFCYADKQLSPLEHQQIITVKPKEQIIVTLPTDLRTGYMWFLDAESRSSDAIKMVQDWRFTPRKNSNAHGQGDTTWRFSMRQTGEVTLRFVYRKPWQGTEVPPLDVREYRLVIG
ncbi:protease inhibitor I42 family protein [Chitinibacter sp. SCUT-21]|uniref:protease inhibitor I42 family protein n=1 Tax=Chitinibacter sp. SCUT-21 TaxID=2970891 RepID=UPI0035A6DDB5